MYSRCTRCHNICIRSCVCVWCVDRTHFSPHPFAVTISSLTPRPAHSNRAAKIHETKKRTFSILFFPCICSVNLGDGITILRYHIRYLRFGVPQPCIIRTANAQTRSRRDAIGVCVDNERETNENKGNYGIKTRKNRKKENESSDDERSHTWCGVAGEWYVCVECAHSRFYSGE